MKPNELSAIAQAPSLNYAKRGNAAAACRDSLPAKPSTNGSAPYARDGVGLRKRGDWAAEFEG